ncbi:MAG: hypothetical protein KDB80_05770 [Planctomycetes bacterium]|nr:hypothetical protein [Planctomycetota bacterium]
MAPIRRLVLRSTSAALVACAAAAQNPEPIARLVDALVSGRWSGTAEHAYADLALATARAECGLRVADGFWDWLGRTPKVREVVVWATTADPGPKFFQCLERLRSEHEEAVRDLPHLAVGFAFAWSGGDGATPNRRWPSWTRGRSAIPSMSSSFAWYVEHRRELPFRIDRACWKLLAYTALNDVPFDERTWVLDRYRGRDVAELRNLFAEVPYVVDGLEGKAQSLPNMVGDGGVCTVNTQFQMATLRTLGVPATFGGGPGHCWPCWMEVEGRRTTFHRVNDLGNADGTLGEHGFSPHRFESDLRMLADGLSLGVSRLRDADLCGAALDRIEGRAPARAASALVGVLRKNPHSIRAWHAIGASIHTGRATSRDAVAAIRLAAELLADHPRVMLRLLPALLPPTHTTPRSAAIVAAMAEVRARIDDASAWPDDLRRLTIEFLEQAGDLAPEAPRLRLQLLQEARDDRVTEPADGLARTRALGGEGGAPFEDVGGGDRSRLIGFRYSTTDFFGHCVIGSIQPLYADDTRRFAGRTLGKRSGDPLEAVVPDGHRLVGIEARGGDRFDGFRLVSAPLDRNGRADMTAVAFGPWCGGSGNGWGILLGARPDEIAGIHGRAGDAIDAMGLVVRR